MNIEKMMKVMDEVYAIVSELDSVIEFGSVIATIIDQWAADHDMNVDEACGITENILKAQPGAWETLGPPIKTVR